MTTKFINKFYGGITRDEKSKLVGVASNVEELDILENSDFIRPSQIMSADALPASTEVYSYTADNADTVFGYGRNTANDRVRIVSVANGGGSNPGAFATLFTAASVTYYAGSPIEYHRSDTGDANRLYWLSISGSTVSLNYCTTAGASETSVGTLTGLDGTHDRLFMRRIFGELFVGNGQYIARVDKSGTFTEKAFTLPGGWEAVDLCEAGASALVLARNVNRLMNSSKGYFWDLTSLTQFDDSFDIPFGGPQWLIKHRETIKIMCAINGEARFWQVSAYAGGVPAQLPGLVLSNIATEGATQAISSQKMVTVKDDIIYFGIYKTDKTGIYAIGQLDSNKNHALYLAKRFHTSDYSLHTPYGLLAQGANFYGAFDDNGTKSNTRCETLNSPTRSSNATYETLWLDEDNPTTLKKLVEVFAVTQPLGASTSLACSVASDYGAYVSVTRADGTALNATSATLGTFVPKIAGVKSFKIRLVFTSSGTTAIKLVGVGWTAMQELTPARK